MRRGAAIVLALLAGSSAVAVGFSAGPVAAQETDAGEGAAGGARTPVRMARATWDTGWFQAEVYRLLLERLGYAVEGPVTMENADFYEAVAAGDVDLWANGWFPLHDPLLTAHEGAERVGTQVDGGALQGYFADLATATGAGIGGLADLADPEIAARFDTDGDGKADLVGCNVGWSCAEIIDHHIEVYGLGATVEQVQGDYSALMSEVAARYQEDLPVLFYTWTPNWTIGHLVPGRDVTWLQTPFPSLPPGWSGPVEDTLVDGVAGCANDPCATGWPPNDIAAVANSAFLQANPPVRRLLEVVTIPLEDILVQNGAMVTGAGDPEDITAAAAEWVARNEAAVVRWLSLADPDYERAAPAGTDTGDPTDQRVIRVAARVLRPFVTYENQRFGGFEVELISAIADSIGARVEFHGAATVAKQIDEVTRGAADVALGGIDLTEARETAADFSIPVIATGLTILVHSTDDSGLDARISNFFSAIGNSDLPWLLVVFLVVVLVSSHLIWWLERRHNEDFGERYGRGIWDSFYWSVVTMSTVGYGDKVARRGGGRAFALLWIVFGTLLFAAFTASIASSLAVSELRGHVTGPEDLPSIRVATVADSAGQSYLGSIGVGAVIVDQIEDAYHLLDTGEVDAVVFDAPVLHHHVAVSGEGRLTTTGGSFDDVRHGFMISPENPELREQINRALLARIESGAYDRLFDRWFGDLD